MKKFPLLLLDAGPIIKLFELNLWNKLLQSCDVTVSRTVIPELKWASQEFEDVRIDIVSYDGKGLRIIDHGTATVASFYAKLSPLYKNLIEPDDGEVATLEYLLSSSEKWILGIDSAGNKLKLCATSTGPTSESLEILLPSDFSGWHYFAVLYFKETNTFHVYVDNVVYVKQLSGELITEAIQLFTIGHNDELILFGGGYLDGFVDEVFYCKDYTFEEDEIRKTYSYIIEHDRYLPSDSQEWIFWLDSFGGKKQVDSRIVDSDERYAWYDILGYKDTDLVSIKLYNANHTGVSKPAKPRTLELTTDALDVILALPLEHRLGVVPEVSLKKKVSIDPEFYEYLNAGDYFVASTTHLKLKTGITSLVDELGSGEVVILNYSTASAAHFVPNRFWNTYLVSSDTAVLANDYVLSNTASGIVYLTLPPNPKMGDMVIVGDARNYFGFNSCNINRNGKLINGKSDSYFECDISGKEYVFTYTDATYGWAVYF